MIKVNGNRLILALVAAFFMASINAALAEEDIAKPVKLVDEALNTVMNFKADPDMGWFRENVQKAKGVFVVPSLLKGGFILGGSGGSGVMLARDEKSGEWSYPAFYTMGSGSFGFQAGVEKAEVILMVMSDKGMDKMLSSSFKLGADVSVAVGPTGAGAKVKMADIISFSRTKGVFGGIALEGAVIKTRDGWNEEYYKKPVRSVDIMIRGEAANPHADDLRSAVAKVAG